MPAFGADQADNYGNQGTSTGFFALKDDGDKALVRFMYRGQEDVKGYAVHKMPVNGKDRYINCLREYSDPLDKCPCCSQGDTFQRKIQARVIIPVFDTEDESVKLWDRGRKYLNKLQLYCAKLKNGAHLCGTIYEITRKGKKGDTSTDYEIYPEEVDGKVLEDLPEVPEIIGGLIMDLTPEQMITVMETGELQSSRKSEDIERSANDLPRREAPPAPQNTRRNAAPF